MTTGRPARRSPRPWALLVALPLGLALALGIDVWRVGGLSPWLARHGLPPPYVASGERVDIGGRSLYLDCRGAGAPTLVLEAGSGSDSATWSAVHDALASTTRTCAYDRLGRGRSDPAETQTLADGAAQLRSLLEAAGEPGPFVVVAHSLGGAYGRVFASSRRPDVAGLVLVDTFDPDLQADRIHPLLGSLRPEYEATIAGLWSTVAAVDALDPVASAAQLKESSLDGLPIEVIVAARYEPRLDEATNAAIAAAWRDAYADLSPGRVGYTVAVGSGHLVQIDRPDIVIEVVRGLVERIRSGTAAGRGTDAGGRASQDRRRAVLAG